MSAVNLYPRLKSRPRGLSCIDLFSGAGGLAVGFRSASWGILAANDIDAHASATFRQNFPESSFFECGVESLSAAVILKESGIKRGELDCLIGGPPCQSFSYNNHQRSAVDARSRLFEQYLRLVEDLNPKTLLMENVPGILTIDEGSVVEEITESLTTLGYDVAIKTLSAEEYGTPQIRRRVFFAASRVGPAIELMPRPTHGTGMQEGKRKKRLITVGNAIGDLPTLRNAGGSLASNRKLKRPATEYQREARKDATTLYNHICRTLMDVMMERIKHVPEGGNWRDIPFELLPDGMKRARKSDHTKRYGRLSRKGLATTLLTKCDPHWGAYVHPTQNRTISVREAARLQGFPDAFIFAGHSVGKHYAQIGNAVPVPLAKAFGVSIAKHVKKWCRYNLKTKARHLPPSTGNKRVA